MNRRLPRVLEKFSQIYSKKSNSVSEDEAWKLFTEITDIKVPFVPQSIMRRIFELQMRKLEIWDGVRIFLRKKGEAPMPPYEQGMQKVFASPDGDGLLTSFQNQNIKIDVAQILTDGEWGIRYYLDESVPIEIRKEFILIEGKRQMLELYDQQIILYQANRTDKTFPSQRFYQSYEELDQSTDGFLLERILKNFLRKVIIRADLSLILSDVPIHMDIEEKIDFIFSLDRNPRERGRFLRVPFRVGVQVTLQSGGNLKAKLEKREYSLTKLKFFGLNDFRVMSFSAFQVRQLYEKWIGYGKPPGGPEELMDSHTKAKVFSKFLNSLTISKLVDRAISKEYFERGKVALY